MSTPINEMPRRKQRGIKPWQRNKNTEALNRLKVSVDDNEKWKLFSELDGVEKNL